jgi:hypothetical protein
LKEPYPIFLPQLPDPLFFHPRFLNGAAKIRECIIPEKFFSGKSFPRESIPGKSLPEKSLPEKSLDAYLY